MQSLLSLLLSLPLYFALDNQVFNSLSIFNVDLFCCCIMYTFAMYTFDCDENFTSKKAFQRTVNIWTFYSVKSINSDMIRQINSCNT